MPFTAKLFGEPAEDLLGSAVGFCKAASRCLNGLREEPGVEILIVPGSVCAALSCELFLKYIVLREKGAHSHGHNLEKLLQECSADCQAELAAKIPNIGVVLSRNNDHFVEARYHHEHSVFVYRQAELLQTAEALHAFVVGRFSHP